MIIKRKTVNPIMDRKGRVCGKKEKEEEFTRHGLKRKMSKELISDEGLDFEKESMTESRTPNSYSIRTSSIEIDRD